MSNLLFEIYAEEIPASYIDPALGQMKEHLVTSIRDAGLDIEDPSAFGTPRRLVLFATGMPEGQNDRTEEVTGPPESAAYRDGAPTKALEGFVKNQGVETGDVYLVDSPKGKRVAVKKHVRGKSTGELLAGILPEMISKIAFPKSMRWVPGSKLSFARPVRGILALLDEEVVSFEWNGITSGRESRGHPFISPETFEVEKADVEAFAGELEKRCVILDGLKRRSMVTSPEDYGTCFNAERYAGLVDEVTNLVEWPTVVLGEFDEKYLKIPRAVLEAAMTEHQRYFPLAEEDRKPYDTPINKFFFVANRRAEDEDLIRAGNERVLKARLEDAKFFFDHDRRIPLEEFAKRMDKVVFHKDLGTFSDKTARLAALGEFVAKELDFDRQYVDYVKQAARLCKADLATEMVGEFPSLQGTIGKEYARKEHSREVAEAIEEHYLPDSATGRLPRTNTGLALAIADKFDQLCGFLVAGHAPSGAGDPFGLRRAANGIIRIIMESGRDFRLNLSGVMDMAMNLLVSHSPVESIPESAAENVKQFIADRFRAMFRDTGGEHISEEFYKHDHVEAVIAGSFDDILDAYRRLGVLAELEKDESRWERLVEIVERTFNIAKNEEDIPDLEASLLKEDAEKELFDVFDSMAEEFSGLVEKGKYVEAAELYHDRLREPVHRFFDEVFVNVDDVRVRRNRIALSWAINRLFVENIADLKQIVIPGRKG